MASLYVYKCHNNPHTESSVSGDWAEVFDASGPVRWGGAWAWATKNAASLGSFVNELQVGDLILAWQTDEHAAVGVAEVVGFKTKGYVKHALLEARERFPKLVPLRMLRRTTNPELVDMPALTQGNIANFYPTTQTEAQALLKACNSRFATQFT